MPKGKSITVAIVGAVLALDVAVAFIPAIALGESVGFPLPDFWPRTEVGTPTDKVSATAADSTAATAPDKIDRPAAAVDNNPVPARPSAKVDGISVTAAIPAKPEIASDIVPLDSNDIGALKAGLDALSDGDVAAARAYRDGLPGTALDRHILTWAIAMSGKPEVSSDEITAAAGTLAHWPGGEALRINGERALYREDPDPRTVIRAFARSAPQTLQGVKLLARAHLALGDSNAARAVLSPFWRMQKLEAADEAGIIKEFGKVIPVADHRFRMERMLYGERVASALRVAPLAGAKELANAWAAMLRNDKNARKLLDAVPAAQRSPGYIYAKAKYLRRKKDFTGAAQVMLKAPRDAAALVDPDEWWEERRVLSRELVDRGDIKTAYAVVAAHSGGKVSNVIDAEFHAGWYALRGLKDPRTAARHFAAIARVADGPIGMSRAYYWLGRTAEAEGSDHAVDHYKRAAQYGTAFYGQLAAARIGRQVIAVDDPAPTEADRRTFAGREAVRAIGRLEQAGYEARAEILYRELAQQLESPGELALLAGLAEKRGNHFLALRVGKIAANRGLSIGTLAHPVGVIPTSADISGAGQALAYAIARQESEFNVAAVSGAGARGLLQLLPGTARDMAKKSGLPYSMDRLTTDAGYNATLGTAYLKDQLVRFDGSYVLTFIGYNAGPRRADQWVKKYGDPRGKPLDIVVDWIERIPFTETRGYVQRVMENYEVYKMRLSGRFEIADDLVNGR